MKSFLHSNENKFLIVYQEDKKEVLDNLNSLSDKVDGVIFIDSIDNELIFYDLFNIDGSRAEVSGNGLACTMYFIKKYLSIDNFDIIKFVNSFYKLDDGSSPKFYSKIDGDFIMVGFELSDVIIEQLNVLGFSCFRVNLPNPHLVLVYKGLHIDFMSLGKQIFEFFGKSLNVHILYFDNFFMYSFERGVGFTKSCGSGTIACSLVINNFFEKRDVWDIRSTGGTLRIIKEGEMYWLLTKVSQIS